MEANDELIAELEYIRETSDKAIEELKLIQGYLYKAIDSITRGKCKSEAIQYIEDSISAISDVIED